MRMSRMAVAPIKTAPKDAETLNHRLLVQGGFVRQLMAGVYSYLPFGLRVLTKIENVVREEMAAIGSEEILMPLLHPAEIWKKSGGWDGIDVLFKLQSRGKKDYALAQSEEEVVTPLMKEFVLSYKDLPASVYHINWKFRDELRSKSGILRGREFYMKDMYSFHTDQADFEKYLEVVKSAYLKIFSRLGLTAKVTEASGGGFSEKISYEFEVLTDAGEANILYCEKCEFCVNVDDIKKFKEDENCPKCSAGLLKKAMAAEVGNVFDLGQKYSKAFDFSVTMKNGEKIYPVMGCYGIGISRSMGVVVEKYNDERGILWPEAIAPFRMSLISLEGGEKATEEIYDAGQKRGVEMVWDDRDVPAGNKFADADLIGNPYRVVVSKKSLEQGGVEIKGRGQDKGQIVSVDKIWDSIGMV